MLHGPEELLGVDDARFGHHCGVQLFTTSSGRVPFETSLVTLRSGGDREVVGELALAIGGLINFTQTPPHLRTHDAGTWHWYAKGYVKRRCGVNEPLIVFGRGKGTQIRIPAVMRKGRPAAVVLLDVVYKTATRDKRYWRHLASQMNQLCR